MWSKRNVVLAVCVIVMYIGTISFSAHRHQKDVSQNPPISSAPALTESPGDSDGDRNKKGTAFIEMEQEQLYPDEMDISDVPKEILGLLDISAEELSKRIRIFANGEGMATMKKVYCSGEFKVDSGNGKISAFFYFVPEEVEEKNYNFEYIYYKTGEYRIVMW